MTLLKFSHSSDNRSSDWTKLYLTLLFGLLVLLFILLNQTILAGLITLFGLTIAIISTAPSRQINYALNNHGLAINHRHWFWHEFRVYSLTVTPDDVKIALWPVYRFRLPIIIHTPYQQTGSVMRLINYHLPQQKNLVESMTDLFLRATRL